MDGIIFTPNRRPGMIQHAELTDNVNESCLLAFWAFRCASLGCSVLLPPRKLCGAITASHSRRELSCCHRPSPAPMARPVRASAAWLTLVDLFQKHVLEGGGIVSSEAEPKCC